MSNHSGSYMLNDMLKLLEKEKFFEFLGKEKSEKFIESVIKIGAEDDCNPGEILEGIGANLGICYCCISSADELRDDLCRECYGEGFDENEAE